jgi:branched-chain amino acid transport system ATP-binding protein
MILKVYNLKKYFKEVRAVDNMSFTIDSNEVVGIVGPNGAGKTTLINLISGFLLPDDGRIEYLGHDITYLPPHIRLKMGIARSFQIVNLFERISVIDNVIISIFSSRGMTRNMLKPADFYTHVKEEAIKILEIFGLSHKKDYMPDELSEGERKLLDIAIAYATNPRLILMDEPTSGVATKDKFRIMDIIVNAIRASKLSAVIVEHDLDIISSYVDSVLVLNEGRILARGKPNEVLEDPLVKKTLFGISR